MSTKEQQFMYFHEQSAKQLTMMFYPDVIKPLCDIHLINVDFKHKEYMFNNQETK